MQLRTVASLCFLLAMFRPLPTTAAFRVVGCRTRYDQLKLRGMNSYNLRRHSVTGKGNGHDTKDDAPTWIPPPKIEDLYAATAGNQFASINRPTSGAREEKPLERGEASFQLYSMGTPNGQKVGIMLEELGIDYDAHCIRLSGDQFGSGFVGVNPNSKIPAAIDYDGPDGQPIHLFESASICLYLAEKYKKFLPSDFRLRTECMNWLFWQMAGQGPMVGNFGHFFVYAPADKCEARSYGTARYGMEVQRLCHVLDTHLSTRTYIVGEEYTIADICCYPWFNQIRPPNGSGSGYPHPSGINAAQFLSTDQYKHLNAWADRIAARPAVQRGVQVCSFKAMVGKPWLQAKL